MVDVIFTKHAVARMQERGISETDAGSMFLNATRCAIPVRQYIYKKTRNKYKDSLVEYWHFEDIEFVAKRIEEKWLVITAYKIPPTKKKE